MAIVRRIFRDSCDIHYDIDEFLKEKSTRVSVCERVICHVAVTVVALHEGSPVNNRIGLHEPAHPRVIHPPVRVNERKYDFIRVKTTRQDPDLSFRLVYD